MILLVPVLALIIGVLLARLIIAPVPGDSGQYLALACIAGLDTLCGGIRSGLEGKFHSDVFITGFISNVVIAFSLAWFGDRLYIDLWLAVALVLGARIFTNLSLIRRFLLTKWQDARERKRLRMLSQAQAQAQAPMQADTAQ